MVALVNRKNLNLCILSELMENHYSPKGLFLNEQGLFTIQVII